jgi:hypothetical protein
MTDTSAETVMAVVKSSPPITISLATVCGMQVSELVLWATLIYTVILIGYKLYEIYTKVKK